MALAIVQHKSAVQGFAVPGTITLTSTPTVGNLLILFLHCNIAQSSITVNSTKWTQYASADTGGGSPNQFGMALYRYVQVGDTVTVPAPWTAGTSYTAYEIYEVSGVSGTFATDHENTQSTFTNVGTNVSSLSVSHTTVAANVLCLAGAGQYNGTHNPTWNAGFTSDETSNNNTNYGSQSSANQAVASPTAITATVSYGGLSSPADLFLTTLRLGAATETGTGVIAFGGIGFSASATDKTKTIFITSGTTWAVPADFNTVANKFFALGAGGSGAPGTVNTNAGASGGSAGYSSATNLNLTPGSTVTVQIGVGGSGNGAGNATLLKNNASTVVLQANSASNASGSSSGVGAITAGAVGAITKAGANGKNGNLGTSKGGPSGASAPGPTGAAVLGMNAGNTQGGAGGAGAQGGGTGSAGTATVGGAGGSDGLTSAGAGAGATSSTNAGAGTNGGGGGGGCVTDGHANAAAGAAESLWLQSSDGAIAGPSGGGGGGGSGTATAGNGGGAGYGGGGGGGGCNPTTAATGGAGGNGIIVVQYIPAENATATLAFGGIGFSAAGTDKVPEHGPVLLSFRGIAFAAAGRVAHTGIAALHFAGLSITGLGSDVTPPIPPTPPPATAKKFAVDPLTWDTPIVNPDGTPKPEFQQKWNKQNTVNGSVVPQDYVDGQDAAGIAASQQYTQDYGATVLVAAKQYTDTAPLKPLSGSTVAGLPPAPVVGQQQFVTDATAPTFLAPVVGGGAVTTPVMWNGTNWICH